MEQKDVRAVVYYEHKDVIHKKVTKNQKEIEALKRMMKKLKPKLFEINFLGVAK